SRVDEVHVEHQGRARIERETDAGRHVQADHQPGLRRRENPRPAAEGARLERSVDAAAALEHDEGMTRALRHEGAEAADIDGAAGNVVVVTKELLLPRNEAERRW